MYTSNINGVIGLLELLILAPKVEINWNTPVKLTIHFTFNKIGKWDN